MKKILLSVFIICLVIGIRFASAVQAVVTVDPNAPGVQRAVSAGDDIDTRLVQKITYNSGYKRLHDVADDLDRISGVSIASGQSTKDWRVRDIPVVVCVKDMPLGKLLRAIADATHTRVGLEKVTGSSSPKKYRIYRRSKEESEIDSLLENRHAAKLAIVNWQWDAMVAYGKSKEITKTPKFIWPLAKLIASLGPDAKSKMLNSDTFRFSGRDAACKETINDLYQLAWSDMKDGMGEEAKTAPSPTSQDAEYATLSIKLMDSGDTGITEIQVNLDPMIFGRAYTAWTTSLNCANSLQNKGLDLPPYPKDTQTPSLKDDMENPEMTFLRGNYSSDWKKDLLMKKVDLEKPKDKKEPVFADLISALASATGCNIVIEDFASHLRLTTQAISFNKSSTITDKLCRRDFGGILRYEWFFNENDKLLIGWVNKYDHNWRDMHRIYYQKHTS